MAVNTMDLIKAIACKVLKQLNKHDLIVNNIEINEIIHSCHRSSQSDFDTFMQPVSLHKPLPLPTYPAVFVRKSTKN
jgi:hypothetical protein